MIVMRSVGVQDGSNEDGAVANEFPEVWFETFLSPENAAPVDRELEFIERHFPLAQFTRLIDVPCGIGRHAGPLAEAGYHVVGIDRSAWATDVARARYPGVDFRTLDMFELAGIEEIFDGLVCLWQSFGYGSSEQNVELLACMRALLRPGGRLLMDIYNADAAAKLPKEERREQAGRSVRTTRTWLGARLRVELEYSDAEQIDVHEWELYSPREFGRIAETVGLDVVTRCAWFDPNIPPTADHLRMQFLLERPG
jgi:SAM-dependent methyltransferase